MGKFTVSVDCMPLGTHRLVGYLFCSTPSESLVFSDGLRSRQWRKCVRGLCYTHRVGWAFMSDTARSRVKIGHKCLT